MVRDIENAGKTAAGTGAPPGGRRAAFIIHRSDEHYPDNQLAPWAWTWEDASVSSNSLLRIGFKPADTPAFFFAARAGGGRDV